MNRRSHGDDRAGYAMDRQGLHRCGNDWDALLAHRFDPGCEMPQDWPQTLAHLDRCEPCRRKAYRLDPSLAFLRTAPLEVDAREIQQIHQAVNTLKQGFAVANNHSAASLQSNSPEKSMAAKQQKKLKKWRWTAAAAIAATLWLGGSSSTEWPTAFIAPGTVAQHPSGEPEMSESQMLKTENLLSEHAEQSIGSPLAQPIAPVATWYEAPVVDTVENAEARVYQYPTAPEDNFHLIMVIDPSLDV